MKVTVCFGNIRVVVPCGNGDLTVAELMEKSVQRYRKAAGRTDDYWVRIQSLKSEGEEAILDTDDQVCDVADDREKLIATFAEQDGLRPPSHLITDGTSTCASSVGTASPPLTFHSLDAVNGQMNNSNNKVLANHYGGLDDSNDVDVVVTGDEISTDPKLHVRRGSDPIMPVIVNGDPQKWNGNENEPIDTNANSLPKPERKPSLEMIKKRRDSRDELNSAFSRFGRNSSRQSISNTLDNDTMYKWAEAQQRMENKGNDGNSATTTIEREQIIIKNDGTPLGIQIIARVENDDDSAYGLVIHGIETGGRAARDGRLREGDHMLTINKLDITEMSFDSAQELLRDAMRTDSVTLTVEREAPPLSETTSPANEITDTPKVPPDVPARAPATSLSKEESSQKVHNIIAPTNTRRIGRKLYVQLMKGPQGLGFSITTRDNAVGGKNPIYIKNILPKGAAIADGRCKPGDRLLEVNGIEMTGKTQSEAVSILRSVRLGGVVNLVLSRQDANSPAPTPEQALPREMPEDKNTDDPTNAKNKRVLVFDIPLNDTGSAGLGVSVKGKTSGNGTDGETKDLGIFIKSVIHGGAASKDGRLRPNDQLLYINEESLIGISNSSAMEILRSSMSGEKSPRSGIRLVVARRTDLGEITPTANRPAGVDRAESMDGEVGPCPGSPVSISSRGMEIDMDAMDELFKHPVLNKLSALESSRQAMGPGGDGYAEDTGQLSPTMPKGGAEVFMIEDADIDDAIAKIDAGGPSSGKAPSPPQWLVETWEKAEQDNGEPSPVDDPYNQFQRDSFARRSFSERHKGSLDAKELAWYKRKYGTEPPRVPPKGSKNLKGRPQQKDIAIGTGSLVRSSSTDNLTDNANLSSIHRLTPDERRDIGPSLGLKKNSSLESLQAAVAEVTAHDDLPTRTRAKVVRGRGCNESFRAAVDRSYEQPLNGTAINSTSVSSVKEYKENGHAPLRDERLSRDDHSSVSSHDPVIMSRTGSSKKTNKKEKEKERERKKSGAFKGFGSMFRFGKNRKPERDGRPAEEDQGRTTSVSSEKPKEDMEKYKEQEQEQNSRIQDEVRKLREQQSLKRHKEESEEARHKAERMQELRQRYQRDHRERQGRYVGDDEDSEPDEEGNGDREDEGYADGSPSSPRSPPHSPHREMPSRHAPEYRDHDHERWERQSEGNHRRSSHSQDDSRWPDRRDEYSHAKRDDRREDKRPADAEGRHRYGRHSVPPYMESRTRNGPRDNPDRNREPRTSADVPTEPHYAVVRKPRPNRNDEPHAKDRHGEKTLDRERAERIREEHPYASVEMQEPHDHSLPKRSPEKLYESMDGERPRDHPREDRNRDDWSREERNREDRHLDDRYQEERSRDKRYHDDDRPRDRRSNDDRPRNDRHNDDRLRNEHYNDERYQEGRFRSGRNREDRHHDDRYGDKPDSRRADRREDRREETAKKHNDPVKVKNSDAKHKRKESETESRKESDTAKSKETPKSKDSDKSGKDKKADKSKVKENDKKDSEKEEFKLTRRKSDKDKKKENKKKDKAKSKDKEEKVSSDEEKPEERSAEPRRDHRREDPRNDRRDGRHHDDRRGDTLDRRHRGERGTGDGRDHQRDEGLYDGRREGRDRQRSSPPGDKYGYGSLGRPTRRRSSNDPNQQYHRGPRESGYQSDHDRHRPDKHDSNHRSAASNHKGYANGPTTSSHYPEERRPRIASSHSTDHVRDAGYREDYGMLKQRSRSDRRMHHPESGQDYDAYDAARV